VKIGGEWVYLYRAVDGEGDTVDFRLSTRRDVAAAKAFFRKAIEGQGSSPRTVTLDGYAASHRAVREMKADAELPAATKLRSSKYLNNLVEQDHRGVKLRIGHAWVQAFQDRCDHHSGDRTALADPQGAIQSQPSAISG
jgi:transposase-like protein